MTIKNIEFRMKKYDISNTAIVNNNLSRLIGLPVLPVSRPGLYQCLGTTSAGAKTKIIQTLYP